MDEHEQASIIARLLRPFFCNGLKGKENEMSNGWKASPFGLYMEMRK